MKKIVDDRRTIIKVCDMFYNQDMTQSFIAKHLGLSRPTISRMLCTAKEKGIVKISIANLYEANYFELERKIENKYNLKEVIVVDTLEDEQEQKDEAGKATARYLESIITEGAIIGVSMGTTLMHISKYIHSERSTKCMVVPLIGGVGQIGMELHANQIAENLAKAFKGHFMLLHAAAHVSNYEIKEALMQENHIKQVMNLVDNMDIALVGIGTISENSTVVATGYYDDCDLTAMRQEGVVGDICMRFMDIHGDTSLVEKNANVIGVELKKLRKIPYSIGVATGREKAIAVKGAINGGYINILITDEVCARELCTD